MNPENSLSRILRGRWLMLARVAWLIVGALAVGLFFAAIPAEYRQLQLGCPTAACASIGGVAPVEVSLLVNLGLSPEFFAAYGIALELILALVFIVVAILIFWQKSSDRQALFVSFALLLFGTATQTFALSALVAAHPAWGFIVDSLHFLGSASFSLFLFIFPDGRFVPRWTRWVTLVWIAWLFPRYWFPDWPPSGSAIWLAWLNLVVWLVALGTVVYTQVYRYRRVSNRVQRQQSKWVVFGIALGLAAFLTVNIVVSAIAPVPTSAGELTTLMVGAALMNSALLLIPLSIGIAVLRYHLFDIDILINRTLVYGALTVSVVGIYVLVVGYLSVLFRMAGGQGQLAISVLATGLVAFLFQPLRNRLQRGINRLMYGERDDPYAVLSRLGQRLEATLAPEAVLPTIVETVKESLKLPYTAITLKQDDSFTVAAASGAPVDEALRLPLVYQNEMVGQLLLAPRAPGESFSSADRRLLEDLAREAGVAVHAVRLTTNLRRMTVDLQRSREHLVSAREEERRRMRRDLHDGLGPTLASLSQLIDTARLLVARDPDAAVTLLGDVKDQIKVTITDIRRLVYALRPPVLDELGLVSAIGEHIERYNQPNGLQVSINAPDHLPVLPAAVEVAAYHIALEALTNVARHANAQTCRIRMSLESGLCLEITDDGDGMPMDKHAGVGLTSMRERAAELGGEFKIEPDTTRGTRVWARLPLPTE